MWNATCMSQERHTYRSGVDDSYAGRSVCARVHCGSGEWLTGALSVSRLAHASRRGSRYLNRLVVSRVVSCVCPVLGLCGGPRAAACGAAGARWRAAGASARAPRDVRVTCATRGARCICQYPICVVTVWSGGPGVGTSPLESEVESQLYNFPVSNN